MQNILNQKRLKLEEIPSLTPDQVDTRIEILNGYMKRNDRKGKALLLLGITGAAVAGAGAGWFIISLVTAVAPVAGMVSMIAGGFTTLFASRKADRLNDYNYYCRSEKSYLEGKSDQHPLEGNSPRKIPVSAAILAKREKNLSAAFNQNPGANNNDLKPKVGKIVSGPGPAAG